MLSSLEKWFIIGLNSTVSFHSDQYVHILHRGSLSEILILALLQVFDKGTQWELTMGPFLFLKIGSGQTGQYHA